MSMSQKLMPQTQTHENLKKKLDMLMLEDTAPVSQVLNQSNGAHTMTNAANSTSGANYASLMAAAQAQQHHNT